MAISFMPARSRRSVRRAWRGLSRAMQSAISSRSDGTKGDKRRRISGPLPWSGFCISLLDRRIPDRGQVQQIRRQPLRATACEDWPNLAPGCCACDSGRGGRRERPRYWTSILQHLRRGERAAISKGSAMLSFSMIGIIDTSAVINAATSSGGHTRTAIPENLSVN